MGTRGPHRPSRTERGRVMERVLAVVGFVTICLSISDAMFGASIALRDLPPGKCWGVVTTYAYWVLK